MKFQNLKRIMCCLMAALILCCAVVRPIEASATGLGGLLTATAPVVGISPGLAVAGILAALGVGAAASGDFEDVVSNIVKEIPADFIIETMSGTEMLKNACILSMILLVPSIQLPAAPQLRPWIILLSMCLPQKNKNLMKPQRPCRILSVKGLNCLSGRNKSRHPK